MTHAPAGAAGPAPAGPAPAGPAPVERLRAWVHDTCGVVAGPEREGGLADLLMQRARQTGAPSSQAYLERVLSSPPHDPERALLLDQVLVHETSFYRAHADLEAMAHLAAASPTAGTLRIWSAGCSDGAEPYTLAMVLRERLGPARRFEILGTDVSVEAIRRAREGAFPERALAALPPPLLRASFVPPSAPGGPYRILPGAAAGVRFEVHNLVRDPYPGPFDAILCRNVTIYFDAPTRAAVLERFRDALRPGGALVLGSAAALVDAPDGFDLVWIGGAVAFRLPDGGEAPSPLARRETSAPGRTAPRAPIARPDAGAAPARRILTVSLVSPPAGAADPWAGLREQFHHLLASGIRGIVLDLDPLAWIDADGVAILQRALRALAQGGCRVHIAAGRPAAARQARRLAEETQTPLFPDAAGARAALAKEAR